MTAARYNRGDSRRFYDWMNKAAEDLEAARLLYKYGGPHAMGAFHCQQCIEKALKGYLLLTEKQAPDGHNLTYLCRRAMRHDPAFQEWMDESAALNAYYIQTRYPSDFPLAIGDSKIRQLLDMAGKMYEYIQRAVREEFI